MVSSCIFSIYRCIRYDISTVLTGCHCLYSLFCLLIRGNKSFAIYKINNIKNEDTKDLCV